MPALDYLKEKGAKSLFLVGSDYVFPQTANKIIKAYAAANGMEIKGEEYAPLGYTDFSTIVSKVKSADADAVFNTLNGDSNVAFFKEYKNAGLTADAMPVLSVSIAEEEVGGIGDGADQAGLVSGLIRQEEPSAQVGGVVSVGTGARSQVGGGLATDVEDPSDDVTEVLGIEARAA